MGLTRWPPFFRISAHPITLLRDLQQFIWLSHVRESGRIDH